jgi:hypothetical protein
MPFGDAVQSEAALRELFPQQTHNSYRKQIDRPEVLRAHTGAATVEETQARLDERYTQRLW